MKLSIIIPAYNEETRIAPSIQSALDYLTKQNYNFEIIVSDDGSKDKTIEIAKSFGEKIKIVSDGKNFGKGAAVRKGMIAANGDIRIFTDADFSTPIKEIEKLLNLFYLGNDVCIGSRALNANNIKLHQPFYREFMGKTFNKFVQTFVIKGISDTQCGFKGFTKDAAIKIFSLAKIDGFSFDVEALYIAKRLGLKIKQTSVEWFNDDRSTVNPIVDSAKMLYEILKIKALHKNDFR